MRAAVTLAAFVAVFPAAPVEAQDEAAPGPVEHAGIEGGGHGEHEGHTAGGHHAAAPPLPVNWYQWHTGKDIQGGELEGDEEPMPPGFLFAILNFAVFLGLLVKFARPKLVGYLRTRHEAVKGQLDEAARLRADARAKLDEYNRRIAGVDAEVNKLLAEIRAEAEAEREMILAQARSQANALKLEAQRRIDAEIARARLALEREVAAAAVAAAEVILRERTTSDDQARMFGNFVDALLAGPPGAKPETATKVDEDWS
ncbi:MAG TPA: ATP synthase F0 subunit B [Kofleriaceae bacterium]|nr:ATP synthase F0 subunit B [Kofleriaceae bacterium]